MRRKAYVTLRKQQSMRLITQPSLQPEHWRGTKASQLKASTSLSFNEVPMTPPRTLVMNFLWNKYHPDGQEITANISNDVQSISRSKDPALLPQSHSKPPRCSASMPERWLWKEKRVYPPCLSKSGAGSLIDKWGLLDSTLQVLGNAPLFYTNCSWTFWDLTLGCFIVDEKLKS